MLNHQTRSRFLETLVVCLFYDNKKAELEFNFSVKKNNRLRVIILVSLKNNSRIELKTNQNHNNSLGYSNLLCKSIVDESSKFSYFGKIFIDKKADYSHSYQRNENLILDSESAVVSKPSLEILGNSVFCTHGSYTSYLDPEQIYYLQTRGLPFDKSRDLLKRGFLMSGLDSLLVKPEYTATKFKALSDKIGKYLKLIN